MVSFHMLSYIPPRRIYMDCTICYSLYQCSFICMRIYVLQKPLTLLINDATEKIWVWFCNLGLDWTCVCHCQSLSSQIVLPPLCSSHMQITHYGFQLMGSRKVLSCQSVRSVKYLCFYFNFFLLQIQLVFVKHCPAKLCTLHFGPPTQCLDGFQSVRTLLTMCGEFQHCPDNFNTFLKKFNTVRTVFNRTDGFKTQQTFYA